MKHDLLIVGGRVIDGLGNTAREAAVAVDGDTVVAVDTAERSARRVIDASGRVVAPGFIDMHTHSDLVLVDDGVLPMKLAQGITLEVLGQDGLSCAPVDDGSESLVADLIAPLDGETVEGWRWRSVASYLDTLDRRCAQNIAYLVPHGTVRAVVVGGDERTASPLEVERMRALVAQGLREGALGLSTGLSYPPAHASTTDEVVELARALPEFKGVYVTHLRSYGSALVEATEEALLIGRVAGVPVHFSHFQAPGRQHHGRAPDLLRRLEQARADGLDVTFDAYPYESASTMLTAFLPPPIRFLPRRDACALLRDATHRLDLIRSIDEGRPVGMDVEWSDLRVANGLSALGTDGSAGLVDIARHRGASVGETVADLLVTTECRASVVAASTAEADVTACICHPLATAGSDGLLIGERPHPRGFGTFPRFLRRLRSNGVSLEQAVHAMTGRSAQRLGLRDRGRLAPGAAADVCVFDADAFVDRATYDEPTRLAQGMDLVVVNGEVVWESGAPTGTTPGRALRRGGRASAWSA